MTTRHNTADFSTAALASPHGAIGSKGPWQLSDGSVLFFVYSTSTGVITPKRSNPAVGINTAGSWSSKSTWTVPSWSSQTLNGFGGFQVGDTIHIAVINQSNNTLYYQSYNASTDTWGTSTAVSTATKASSARCAIVVRSSGDVVIGYENAPTISAAARTRPNYARRISGTWTADVNVSGDTTSAFNQPLNSVTLGASDRVHFTYWTGASPFTWQHRSLSSANALDTAQQWLTGVTSITSFFTGGMSDYMVNQAGSTVICVPVSYFSSTSGQWVTGVMNAISQANATPEYTNFPTQYNFQDQNIVGMSNTHASWDPNPHRFRWMAVYTATSPSPPVAFYYDYADTFHVGDTYSDNINDFNPDLETPEFIANNSANNYYGARAIQDPTDGSIWVVGINDFSYAAITAYQEYSGPGVPTGLKAARVGANGAQLSWVNGGSATSYNIYRGGTKIGSTTNTSYTDPTMDPSTAFSYTVRGVANGWESADSTAVSGTTTTFKSPADLVGLGQWYDAVVFATTVDGTDVGALGAMWADRAGASALTDPAQFSNDGNGNSVEEDAYTQTSVFFRKTGINNAPALEIGSSASSYILTQAYQTTNTIPNYIFVAMQPPAVLAGALEEILTVWSSSFGSMRLYLDAANTFKGELTTVGTAVGATVATAGTPTVLTAYSDGTTASFLTVEKKGSSAVTANAAAGGILVGAADFIGSDGSLAQLSGGRFAEIIYMEGPLSTTNLANVQTYLRNKYLTTTPPTYIYSTDSGTVTESGATSVVPQISASDSGTATDAGTVYAPTTLTLFSSPTAAAELSGIGGTFSTTAPGTTATTQALAKVTGWGEILAKGNASAWPGLGAQGAVSGKGWWFDSTVLEGTVLQVPGFENSTLDWYTNAGSPVVTIVVRFFKWSSGGGFSLLGSINQTTNYTLPTATSTFGWLNPASFVLAGTAFATGEKLYMDLWANVTTGSGSNSATINYQPNSSQLSVAYMVPYTLNITNLEQGVASESTSIAVIPQINASDSGAAADAGVNYSVNKMPPDAVLATTNIGSTLASVTDDPDAPDGTFDNAVIITNADDMRTSFGTPTGALKTGGPYQEFRIYLRPSGG